MRNILAENMLRFGVKNLSNSDMHKIQILSEADESGIIRLSYKHLTQFKPGASDASLYIDALIKGLTDKINSNAATKAMLGAGSIKLVSITIQGGASNVWGGKTTGFDTELGGTTKTTPTETILYGKNIALAKTRAQNCYDAMMPKLKAIGIKTEGNQATITSVVYNTNGQLNEAAQNVTVSVGFNWLSTTDISVPTEIKKTFIETGQYRCIDGKSPTGQVYTDTKVWAESVAGLTPEQKKDDKRLLAFEIKWNANVLKNPYKAPWYRWVFYYGTDGKIKNIRGTVYDTALNTSLSGYFKNSDNIPKTDPAFLHILQISGYDKIVAPYL